MSRRSSILWAVAITIFLFLALPGAVRSITDKISDSIQDSREGPLPEQGAPPIEVGLGRFVVECDDSSSFEPVAVFAPDGETVAASWTEGDKTVVGLFDKTKGGERWRIAPKSYEACGLAFAPDGRTLAIGEFRKITLLDPENGRERSSLEYGGMIPTRLAYSADGQRLVAAEAPFLHVIDTATKREVATLRTSSMELGDVAISPDGKAFASAGLGPMVCRPMGLFGMGGVGCGPKGGRIWLWDANSPEEPRIFTTRGRANAVAFAPDGLTLASGGSNGVRLWNTAEGKARRIADIPVFSLAYGPDGRTLALGTGDLFDEDSPGQVRLWDGVTRRVRLLLRGDLGAIRSLAFAPDGKSLVAGGRRGIMLWDLPEGTKDPGR